jgi:hypothetical protein
MTSFALTFLEYEGTELVIGFSSSHFGPLQLKTEAISHESIDSLLKTKDRMDRT